MDQPSFQPVTLNVFPALPMVTVLSHMPGSVPNTPYHIVNATTIYKGRVTCKGVGQV